MENRGCYTLVWISFGQGTERVREEKLKRCRPSEEGAWEKCNGQREETHRTLV